MRQFLLCFFISTTILCFGQKNRNTIGFTENKGQIVNQKGKENKSVLYLLNTPGLNVQLKKNSFSYDIYETKKIPLTKKDKAFLEPQNRNVKKEAESNYSLEYSYHRIDIDFLNSNSNVQLIAEEKSNDYDNYYNINHAPEGITNVYKYKKVTYKNLYNQIDAIFFIPNDSTKAVEYNFIVKPGGKVSDIQLKFNGAKTELSDNKIKMDVRFGQMEETIPLSWIDNGDTRKEISVSYTKERKNVYGFTGYFGISNKTIIIDPTPTRLWGTFYGGKRWEQVRTIESDNQGTVYISGYTNSKNFIATTGAHQGVYGSINTYDNPTVDGGDGFIAKFDSNGNKKWSTYYGGSREDWITDIAISNNNMIGFCGNTWSSNNIATPNSFKNFKSDLYQEMFLGILDSNGVRQWATYFGGYSSFNSINSIIFDSNNDLYIGGVSVSINYIATPNAFKNTVDDCFISKFSLSGNQIWGTYYGGNMQDSLQDLTIDSNNNVIAVGYTKSSSGISTSNSFQPLLNNSINYVFKNDGFIVSFSSNGSRNWGTYFGSSNDDFIHKVKYLNGSIYLSGESQSSDLATSNAFLPTNNDGIIGYNAIFFIAKYDIINHQKTWFSYSYPQILDFDINQNGEIILVGNHYHYNPNLETACSYISNGNIEGSYMRKINNNCSIIWSTYLSISDAVRNPFVKYTSNSMFYISGTYFTNPISPQNEMTTLNSNQEFSNGNSEGYINKFEDIFSLNSIYSDLRICIGENLQLSASGGVNYLWTGPNGFTSTDQNPVINNVNSTHSGQYNCTITEIGGCERIITVNVAVGDTTAPIADITNLPTITGDCNTVITTIPLATDNCAGTITATTTSPLNYSTPGTYTIIWDYNDGSGNISSQNQTVMISATALPTATSPQQFCIQQNATLNDVLITGQNIQWYDALTGGNLLNATTLLQNGVTYYASQIINGCESTRVPVFVTIQNTPAPTGNSNQSFCFSQNATLNDVVITGNNIIWYNSSTGNSILPVSTVLADNTIYYATQTINNCESNTRFAVTTTLIRSLNANNYSETICDDLNDGIEIINLSSYNTNLIATTNSNTFSYYNSYDGAENLLNSDEITNFSNFTLNVGNYIIFVRIDSNNGCHQIVQLSLSLVKKPIIPINDIMPICEGSSITVNAGNGFDSYLWSTSETSQSINISTPGNYSVTVTKNHGTINCSTLKTFIVVNSNAATIQEIITSDWTSNQNTITVILTANSYGNYLYSIDGVNYQTSNTFSNLPNGELTVFIKDANGCGITPEDVYLLMFPHFFTPNEDGYNDTWKIEFSEIEPNLTIKIFNRFGKLLKELDSNSKGWDGTYIGQPLPSDDYWFVVKRNNGKEFRGHFALKR